jgi:hypothetical protein
LSPKARFQTSAIESLLKLVNGGGAALVEERGQTSIKTAQGLVVRQVVAHACGVGTNITDILDPFMVRTVGRVGYTLTFREEYDA